MLGLGVALLPQVIIIGLINRLLTDAAAVSHNCLTRAWVWRQASCQAWLQEVAGPEPVTAKAHQESARALKERFGMRPRKPKELSTAAGSSGAAPA